MEEIIINCFPIVPAALAHKNRESYGRHDFQQNDTLLNDTQHNCYAAWHRVPLIYSCTSVVMLGCYAVS